MAPSVMQWLRLSLTTFLLLILLHLALPALLLVLNVRSFAIGHSAFWVLRWENTPDQTGIQFNLLFLLAIAVLMGSLVFLFQRFKSRWF